MDQERFDRVRSNILCSVRERPGIGTYKEKTLHAVLKDFYGPDRSMQEVRVNGFVADIFTGEEIIEIQTGNFNRIRSKLERLLPCYPVTIVYPVPKVKYLSWIDEETGECSKPRKSTVKGSVYRAFYELYKIKPYLPDPNLHFCFPLLEIREYRLLNGWSRDKKRGSERYDRIPGELLGEVRIQGMEDYRKLIPDGMTEPFTAKELANVIGERKETAAKVLHILNYLQVVMRCGKSGNAYTYIINKEQ